MIHGGDTLTYKDLYSGDIVDYSSNINPLGPPQDLKNEIIRGFDSLSSYPDIKYRELKKEIAKYLGCKDNEVIVGNGAVEIINNMICLFKRVVIVIPCFAEYIKRPEILNKEIIKICMEDNFKMPESRIIGSINEGDLLILGNPNNPTGKRIDRQELINIHDAAVKKGAFLLLDEAFFEFCPYDYDSIELFNGSKNVCIIRAATKFFSLPGIRLGYAYANPEVVEKYNSVELPWSINTFADIAGRTIFNDKDYIRKSKEYTVEQRAYLLQELRAIDGINVLDTDCNFILIKLLNDNEDNIFKFMIERGFMIRKASSFEGLDKSYIRVAVKDFENNRKLIDCFKEYSLCRK